ncbi:MAG: hypothetical protein HQ488_05525 [Parcubacteria group bacterium]|nr:hypothetical protein [Parcubacteria group bacterium]
MTKIVIYLVAFLALFTLEISFVYSLPAPLDRLPIMIIGVVFLYLYAGFPNVIWWMVFHGILLDTFSLSFVPLHWAAYMVAAVITTLASKHIFSNRSFYGVAATTSMAIGAMLVMEILLSTGGSLVGLSPQFSGTIISVRVWGMGLSIIFLIMLFPFSTKIKTTLQWLFQQYS